MIVRSYTLVPNEKVESQQLDIPAIFVLKDWTSQDKIIALLKHFAGCYEFSVWLHHQEMNIEEGVHCYRSPAMLVNAVYIGNLTAAMGVLRFIPNSSCLPIIKHELQAVRVKVMPEQVLADELLVEYQTRFLNSVHQRLAATCQDTPIITMGNDDKYYSLQNAHLMIGDHGNIWSRLHELPWTPNTLATTVYYLERQPNDIGLLLHRLQINYSDKLKRLIDEHQLPKSDSLVAQQNRLYLESLIADIFATKTMDGVLRFCELDSETTILDYCVEPKRACQTVFANFTFRDAPKEKEEETNFVATPYIQSVMQEMEPIEAVVINDNFEAELILARTAQAERFVREQQTTTASEDYLDAMMAVDPYRMTTKKSQHNFHSLQDYRNIIQNHIIPYLTFRDATMFAKTCKEFYEQFGIFNKPELLLAMAQSSTPNQLHDFLLLNEHKIREIYKKVMSRVNVDPKIVIAVQMLKALIMNVSKHNDEGITLEVLQKLRVHLAQGERKSPLLLKSIDFIIDILTQRATHPFIEDAHFMGIPAYIYPEFHSDEFGGFAPWTYRPPQDDGVYYKNLRGFNLCSTDLRGCNWDFACFDGANVKTAYFGENKLKNTEFFFSAEVYGMMVTRKYLGHPSIKVRYFRETTTKEEVHNILSLLREAQTHGMSYLYLSAIQPIARHFKPEKFINTIFVTFAVCKKLHQEMQMDLLNQLLAVVRRMVTKGEVVEALLVLNIAYYSDFFKWKKAALSLRTAKYKFFSKHPSDIIQENFNSILAEHADKIPNDLLTRLQVFPEATIDKRVDVPLNKDPFRLNA